MFSKRAWLILLFASLWLLYTRNYFKEINLNFLNQGWSVIGLIYSGITEKSAPFSEEAKPALRVFTADELKKYTNTKDGLYISILGQVFDVTKGATHYGPEATYHALTGRDASLAFITGEFEKKGLTDDTSSLSVQQVRTLDEWVQFYNKNYIYKGKLTGRYYNTDGSPTSEFYRVQDQLVRANNENVAKEQKRRMLPPCNVEWNPGSGTVVWCTNKSGGVERDWIGVPRMLYESSSSQQYRCACVKINSAEYEETKGALREYTGCPEASAKCVINVNGS